MLRGMKTPAPIHIFRPGTHTDVSGQTLAFAASDLEASAKAYDPALHEAPLVVGHPTIDAPAYGWVQSLAASADGLSAQPRQVDPAFAEMVRAGRFKKISASFYLPDAPANPAPGVYYLRHVGFLGAAAPAVKGLKPVAFAAGEAGVVEFADDAWAERQNAGLWRQLREWLIGKFGLEEADRALPSYQVETVEDAARDGLREEQDKTAFAEGGAAKPQPKEGDVDPKDKEALEAERAKLAAERAKLDKDKAEFVEREAKLKETEAGRIHAEHLAFCEGLAKEGRLLPANKDATVALLDHLSAGGGSLDFTEADGTKKAVASAEALKSMLKAQPPVVDFAERATGDLAADSVSFAAPQGYSVDAARLELHGKALAYQESHPNTSYATAVAAVGGK
jgi:hypothetical protein